MQILEYLDFLPNINETHFIAQGVAVIGRVELGDLVNIWFNAVIRGDVNKITIGENTNIQDLSMLHVTEKHALSIGKNVTIGHSVILHGCSIGDGCLIGMGSKILDGAIISKNSLVAAGSVVPPGKNFPEGVLIMGSPAKVMRSLSDEELNQINNHYKSYLVTAENYRKQKH